MLQVYRASQKAVMKKDLINVEKLINDVIKSFEHSASKREIEMKTHLPKRKVQFYADKDKLTQLFINLIDNAIKFTEKGSIEIGVINKKNEIEFFVSDTGKGITPEDLQHVFDKFKQFDRFNVSGEKGSGLGLSICEGIVELHGGKIWIESELGKGTTVFFTIHNPHYSRIEFGIDTRHEM